MVFRSILLALLILPASASKHRGLWFWAASSSPYGSANIVGNNTLENQTIAFFNARSIKRVYGSYGVRPVSEAATIAAWNAKLQAEGIQSQFLMSENTWIFPANHASFLDKVQQRVIDFNNAPGRLAAEKFDALHLDIEPQALPEWGSLTDSQQRDYLFLLRDTYAAVRQLFVDAGMPTFPIYADLPVWFDTYPGGSIGWTDAAERDQWFDDISAELTGISLMPFDRDTFSNIDSGVTWELANVPNVRVGIESDVPGTWPDVPAFHDMMEQLEIAYGPADAVDIQSYRGWREVLAAQPIIAIAADLQPYSPQFGDIVFDGDTGWNYVIHFTSNLCEWREVARMRATAPGPMTCPVEFTGSRGFWKVSRFQDLPNPE
ncbi:amidase [Haloferula helveola]|uniref:Amidase n=1 Tax=Haloferula helveola TaxID=490095 RepID=A0ABM7RAP0_9BACT|nr:amidase [Haloferula helveola]